MIDNTPIFAHDINIYLLKQNNNQRNFHIHKRENCLFQVFNTNN